MSTNYYIHTTSLLNVDVYHLYQDFPKKYQPGFLHQPIRRFTNHPQPPWPNPHRAVGVAIEVGSGTLPDPPPERWDWTPFQLAEIHGAYKWGSLKAPLIGGFCSGGFFVGGKIMTGFFLWLTPWKKKYQWFTHEMGPIFFGRDIITSLMMHMYFRDFEGFHFHFQ